MPRRYGTTTAALIVVASMIGTGIFTTTGLLIRDIGSPAAVLLAWVLGGLMAMCGALAYAELATAYPNNGGEYQLLSRVYHPCLGFVAGSVSLLVGFAAPMAAAALACGQYTQALIPGLPPLATALTVVVSSAVLHAVRVSWGDHAQNALTALQVLLIVALIVAGVVAAPSASLPPEEPAQWWRATCSPPFAVGLVFVAYSYSGWNAAAYIAGEMRDPKATLRRALVGATAGVTALYVGLTFVFLIAAPTEQLSGRVDIAYVAARRLFGQVPAQGISALVVVGLITTVGALIVTGSRVYEAMGQDYPRLRRWTQAGRTGDQGPTAAIALQAAVASVLLLTSSFDALLTYVGFTLSVFSAITIAGVFVLRHRESKAVGHCRSWGHPWTNLLALILTGWMLVRTVYVRPQVLLAGLATLAVSLLLYSWAVPRTARATKSASRPPGARSSSGKAGNE